MDYLADTVFLIDLWRELASPGPATRFARANHSAQVGICWVVEGEFQAGAIVAGHDAASVAAFLGKYPIVHSNSHIVIEYAKLFATLRRRNQLLGPNDLWIAACALALDLPLLTGNVGEFGRVPGLRVVSHRDAGSA